MMRAALKAEAKERFKAQFGPCVGVQCILLLITAVPSWITGWVIDYQAILNRALNNPSGSAGTLLAYSLLMILISVFTATVAVEVAYFYLRVFRGEKVRMGDFVSGLLVDVGRKAGSQLWMLLFLFLWSGAAMVPFIILLVVLPASSGALNFFLWVSTCAVSVLMIVKALSYSMIPYIIRDSPQVSVRQSMRLSIALMKGNKGGLFLLELSFFGWMLLSVVTLGVLYIVFAGPYMAAATAGFYHYLKRDALANGVTTEAE